VLEAGGGDDGNEPQGVGVATQAACGTVRGRSPASITPRSTAATSIAGTPVAMMKRFVKIILAGRLVLDAFARSGTTGVAYAKSGCRAILVEESAAYCAITQGRLEAVGQSRMRRIAGDRAKMLLDRPQHSQHRDGGHADGSIQ